ncbi:MAG TPA: GerMN domain-containing protein [Acidimicrobiia bacterium]|nr:GerMN domain-containing protein [Acidimicrobiia bacterium]
MIRRVSCLGGLILSVIACTVPPDSVPEIVEADLSDLPQVERQTASDLVAVPLYLVKDGAIVAVTRDLAAPAEVESVLGSLLSGTTGPEERTGLRTSIPTETRLLGVETEGSTVHIDVSRDFAGVGGEEELLAVAQIVLTVGDVEGIESVVFQLEGVPTDVPLPGGALADRPVLAGQYRELLAR